VLTVDVNLFSSELFNPSTEFWSPVGAPPVTLVSACNEIGPGMLRPDGTVLWFGGTGRTATYTPSTGLWTVGPTMPSGYVAEDVPAALLPNGNILVAMGQPETYPDCGHTSGNPPQHTWFYVLNGTSYTFEGGPTNNYPYENRLLRTSVRERLVDAQLNRRGTLHSEQFQLPDILAADNFLLSWHGHARHEELQHFRYSVQRA